MIKLKVSAANIAVEEKETLTEGRVGLLCRFSFTGEWDGLAKTAVFDGADSRDVILTEDTVAVPAECLAAEGYSLSVGVYGKNAAGDIVIPTVYATVGKIQRSAYPSGKETAAPTPDVVAQIQQAAANADAMARSVREDADLGKFNGGQGPQGPAGATGPKGDTGAAGEAGGYYTPAITQPDENTMRMSFTPSKKDMPAVADTDITIPSGGSGSVAVDSTLTVSGQAADAKATGDAIRSLSEEIVTTSESKVDAHNTGTDTHSDIRLLIQGLTDRLNALADSDDTTLDQLSEVVAYIKSNRTLIEAITTSKVSVADIVDNLTTNVANKPLSAAQGVALKELIDALSNSMTAYRTSAAQDVIDSGKVDKVTGKGLSSNDYTDAAKAKVDALAPVATSGSYDDLTKKPTIPDAVTESTVSGWGFTKNTGTYSKPTGGIPKADLANDVKASLGKADTALQEHQSLAAYRTAEAQNTIDNGKQDKITSTNKLAYSLISGTPTIPTVPTNVSAFTNDAGYLTLATLPKYEGVVE